MIHRVFLAFGTALVLTTLVSARPQTTAAGDWQNVEILTDSSPQELDLFMRAMNASLGVDCEYCHQADQWQLDTPEKETARSMMRMIVRLSTSAFEALDLPTCWTCHRGSPDPPPAPESVGSITIPPDAFSSVREPAGEVYENIQLFRDIPAADLAGVMTGFSQSLGVDCSYCHVPGDWASDEKVTKLLARLMDESQTDINDTFFASESRVTCWTCHRGERIPETSLPPGLLSDR